MKTEFWIKNKTFDTVWFIFPQLIPTVLVFFISSNFLEAQRTEIFPLSWLFIVLFVDVAHVYSTIFKTYLNPVEYKKHKLKLIIAPILVWLGGIIIYSISSKLFWTCLAYFAVYHFIRQQYGFFRLYSKKEASNNFSKWVLKLTIYGVTVIPILIWHVRGKQNFHWMTDGDFVYFNLPSLELPLQILLFSLVILYLIIEIKDGKIYSSFNLPRVLLTLSTGFAWYISIVYINNDFVFSLVNVLGHGIPYFALVWLYEKKRDRRISTSFLQFIVSNKGILFFYAIVLLLAFFEETIWDAMVWREHPSIFKFFYFGNALENSIVLTLLIPFLIMPQVVHYILDAYIWKRKVN